MKKSQTAYSPGPHGSRKNLASKEATPNGSPCSRGPKKNDLNSDNFGKNLDLILTENLLNHDDYDVIMYVY